jgi:rhodanese-related sulfurtransferase
MDLKVASTIGFERDHNDLLRETDEARFVERAIATLGPQPPNFHRIVELNREATPVAEPDVRALTPRQVEQRATAGALVVDVRTDRQFDEAHIPGALAITALRAGFGSKLAWLAGEGQDVVLVGRDDEDARRAAYLAAAVGVTTIGGALHGGMTSWREDGRPVQRIGRLTIEELHERWSGDDRPQVLDVREATEWIGGHVPGAVHVPYHDLGERPDGVDTGRPVAVMCASGQRAAVGASLLQRHGFDGVLHVVGGGMPLWARRGFPVES